MANMDSVRSLRIGVETTRMVVGSTSSSGTFTIGVEEKERGSERVESGGYYPDTTEAEAFTLQCEICGRQGIAFPIPGVQYITREEAYERFEKAQWHIVRPDRLGQMGRVICSDCARPEPHEEKEVRRDE